MGPRTRIETGLRSYMAKYVRWINQYDQLLSKICLTSYIDNFTFIICGLLSAITEIW